MSIYFSGEFRWILGSYIQFVGLLVHFAVFSEYPVLQHIDERAYDSSALKKNIINTIKMGIEKINH